MKPQIIESPLLQIMRLTLKDISVNLKCKLRIAPQNINFPTAQLLGCFNQYQWR